MDDNGASDRAAGVDPNTTPARGDWRAQLHHEARTRIVTKLREAMDKHLPVSTLVPAELDRLQKLAVWFEWKSYTAATNQSEYLRKISLRILSLETDKLTRSLQSPGNAKPTPNQISPSSGSDAMDASAADGRGAGVDPPRGDWRAQHHHEARTRIVSRLMEAMKKHLLVSVLVPAGLDELIRLAVRFEENSYAAATNQSDYLRNMALKILSMETNTAQQSPRNAQWRPKKDVANKDEHGNRAPKKQKTGGGAASAPAK